MSSVVVTGEKNEPESPQYQETPQSLQAVLKTRFGMDFDVTTDASGTVAQAKPVEYIQSRDKRTKAVRFGTAEVKSSYSPLTIFIDPEGRVTKEVYRGVYTSDKTSKGYTQAVYEKRVIDYSGGSVVEYGKRDMKSGRETIRKTYEAKNGVAKSYDIINQTDKNYKPRTEEQRALIREKGYRVMNTAEYAEASEYGQKRAKMLEARKTPTGYTAEQINAMKQAEKKARVSTLLTQQAAAQESKKYYEATFNKVMSSPARTENKKQEAPKEQTPILESPTTETKGEPVTFLDMPALKENVKPVLKKAAGYFGEPVRATGQNIREFGEWYTEKAFKYDQSGPSIAAVGAIIEGAGEGMKEKPDTAAVNFGIGVAVGGAVRALEIGGTAALTKAAPYLPASVVKYTPRVAKGTAITVLGGSYAVDVGGRVVIDTEPYKKFGELLATEVVPFAVGANVGVSAADKATVEYAKAKLEYTSKITKQIPEKEIFDTSLKGRDLPTTTKGTQQTVKEFEATREGDYIYGVHASPTKIEGQKIGSAGKAAQGLEDTGLYVFAKGRASGRFAEIRNTPTPEYGLNPFADIAGKIPEPTANIIRGRGIERYPKGVVEKPGFKAAVEYQREVAGSGKFLITKRSQLGQGEVPSRVYEVQTPSYNVRSDELTFKKTGQKIREAGTSEKEAVVPLGSEVVEVKSGSFTEKVIGYDKTTKYQNNPLVVREYDLVVTKSGVKGVQTDKGFRPLTPEEAARVKPVSSLSSTPTSKSSPYPVSSKVEVYSKTAYTPRSSVTISSSKEVSPSSYSVVPSMSYKITSSKESKPIPVSPVSSISRSKEPSSPTYSTPSISSPSSLPPYSPPSGPPSAPPSRPPFSPPPELVPPETPKPVTFSKEKRGGPAYEVSVRQRGIFRKVATTNTIEEAFSAGRVKVQSTAAASFRVSAINQGENTVAAGRRLLPSKTFYESKKEPGVFVQRRGARISSPGEKKEITYKGIFASKTKKARRAIF